MGVGFVRFASLIAFVAALTGPAGAQAPGRYIVVLQPGADPVTVASEHAFRHGVALEHVYAHAIRGYAGVVPPGRLAQIELDPRVRFVSEDRPVRAFAQTVPTGVKRIRADLSSAVAGDGAGAVDIRVAILDTGIDVDHPDLDVVGGVNCQSGQTFDDGNGHGSHVAGTVGALDNGDGVVGVAPGVKLYAVRVLNNAGSGSWASVICGIDWVTGTWNDADPNNDIQVANMSLGGTGSEDAGCATTKDALHLAICESAKTTIYVVAAGNSNADFKGFVPAAYNEVVTVTAMADFNGEPGGGGAATCRADVDETPADFSNYTTASSADAAHTVAAPGVCILSTWKGGGYKTISGTSMASPHVTGVVALCLAHGDCTPGMTASQVVAQLQVDGNLTAAHGFTGDPNSPITTTNKRTGVVTTRHYGYLVDASAY